MNKVEDYLLNAKEALIKGENKKSIEFFTEVLKLEPNNQAALISRGVAFHKIKDYLSAIKDFNRYVELNPKSEKAFCARGNAYLGLMQNERAIEDFNRAIELNPFYPTAFYSRSEYYKRIDDQKLAEADQLTADSLQHKLSKAYLESQGYIFQNI
ncbi:MAG: tetratricopeptide repeat protein [Deltaproteobacteria bacterium]|nr:tetratricopeptide repeat protein [Deltaproteobacteria bacterium]